MGAANEFSRVTRSKTVERLVQIHDKTVQAVLIGFGQRRKLFESCDRKIVGRPSGAAFWIAARRSADFSPSAGLPALTARIIAAMFSQMAFPSTPRPGAVRRSSVDLLAHLTKASSGI